jgi:glycosyltransferase involved in cell wall biosynthesis
MELSGHFPDVSSPARRDLRGRPRVDTDAWSHGGASLGFAAVRPRVVVLRGHQVNPWELRPWEELRDDYDVSYLRTRSGWFEDSGLALEARPVKALRDALPKGRLGDGLVRLPGDRYLGLADHLGGAAIVHSQELGYWYSMQAARLKAQLGFRLVLTVWETIPFLGAYRNVRTRRYRRVVLRHTDLYLAATERARDALLLEGAPRERIRVSPPGVDLDRFGSASAARPSEHLIVSPGRLVWEKGHQDVLRAVAALRRGIVEGYRNAATVRVLIVGAGPDERRLRRYADELGIGDAVELRAFVPYNRMPQVFAEASCVVLASLPVWSWEEQFGMVLAEAMAGGLPLVTTTSGAIPEVVGSDVVTVAPGDWPALARALAGGPLAEAPGRRARHDPDRVTRYGIRAAAERLRTAYREVLSEPRP